jgi:hypothetical protein
MNELLPIIRRKRRPLVEPDVAPLVARNVEPAKVELVGAPTPPAEVEGLSGEQQESHDADVAT